jgi:UDP-N-acetylmuramoyl-tripeptide--D-alanyl-D-alanine ligase
VILAPAELEGLGRVDFAAGAERISGVEIDSRRIGPGDLFVAIGRGADFRDEALARGAAAVLVPDEPFAAMAALGRAARAQTRARVVGITGTAGKTSTKDVLAALCRPHARTVAAEGGHNNEIGLPLTLTRTGPETEVVLAEMGMRGLGEIAELCAIARPEIGVITGIGPVHLERLGSVERVAQAKAEIVAALPAGGVAVVPARAPELDAFLDRDDVELVRFGAGGDVILERFEPPLLLARVAGQRVRLEVPFTAVHQAGNTLAALAAYRALGLPLERVGEGAPEIAFSPWRCEELELPDGTLVINDAYNANPDSMRAALAHLRALAAGRRTVAVLGEMAELGAEAPRYHREVEADVDVVVAVGEPARGYLEGPARETHWVATREEAIALVPELVLPGDAVLVKASRAVGLEVVADALTRVRV